MKEQYLVMIPIKQIPELEWDYDLYTAVAVAQMFAKTVVTLRGLRLLGMLYSNVSEEYGKMHLYCIKVGLIMGQIMMNLLLIRKIHLNNCANTTHF